jgi:hypothetical protein
MPASFGSTSFSPDRLIAGDTPIVTRAVTLVSGQNLTRGAVLGKITTGGKYTLSLSASSDGSQTPDLILAEDCNASGGDKVALAYVTGEFNQSALTIGTAHTADSIREGLRVKGIHLIPVTGA